MKKKKILFVIGAMGRGGKERRLQVLLQNLSKKQEYDIHFAIRNDHIKYHEFKQYDLEYYQILSQNESKNPIKVLLRLFRITQMIRPHLIHVWGSACATYMIPIALMLRIPIINNQITSASKPEKMLEKLTNWFNFQFSDYILSNSLAGIMSLKPPKHKSGVIHNGFDYGRFVGKESQIREELSIPQNAVIIVMAARFYPGKDFETLLKVANKVLETEKTVYFLLVGEGPERKRIESLNTGKRSDNIVFLGLRNDVEEILLGCDIGVLLNDPDLHGEGISNTIMEYMAAGMPVIATNAGGNPEIVNDEVTGFLVGSKDVDQITEKLMLLIKNESIRKQFKENGKERIMHYFSIESFVNKHDELIKKYAK